MYYGDEIGMGDNIYLGDRNGVRTPMQWNSDRNAGFSKAVPAKLYFPVIMDPIWGYQAINVEAQQSDQSSLLHWTRNMIALRKLFQVFGRGTLEFLHPDNRKILAYIRNLDREDGSSETVLCVANLSRFAQPVSLDLSKYSGMQPVEMVGYVSFPTVTGDAYPLTLAPYSFLWLELQPAPVKTSAPEVDEGNPALQLLGPDGSAADIAKLVNGPGLAFIQQLLPTYLPRQRWFGAKARTIVSVSVQDCIELPSTRASILFLEVRYEDGGADTYQLPLALSVGSAAEALQASAANSILASFTRSGQTAVLHDATADESFRQALLSTIGNNATAQGRTAELVGSRSTAFEAIRGTAPLPARTGSAEQSNTSILYGGKLIMKLFRRLQPGENPDTEIGRFLTEVAHFPRIAPFIGDLRAVTSEGEPTTLAMLQGLVENEGDGWEWTLEELGRFYDSVATCPNSIRSRPPRELSLGSCSAPRRARARRFLSRRRHAAGSAHGRDASCSCHSDRRPRLRRRTFYRGRPHGRCRPRLGTGRHPHSTRSSAACQSCLTPLPIGSSTTPPCCSAAGVICSPPRSAMPRAIPRGTAIAHASTATTHLGQILRAKNDFVILDFEGEPARALEERRRKQSPLKGRRRHAAIVQLRRVCRTPPASLSAGQRPLATSNLGRSSGAMPSPPPSCSAIGRASPLIQTFSPSQPLRRVCST